jgi:ribosome-associated toxin RatA of RatAB toxin-antitoxin module
MYTYRIERFVKAPSEIIWAVISDVEGYARHAPNLERTFIVSGEGVGMRRHSVDARGAEWDEVCTVWEEGSRYAMQADTSTYPYPMRHMTGTWGMEDRPSGTVIYMQFDYQPKFDLPIIGKYIDNRSYRPAFEEISRQLMDNWEAEIHNRAGY